MIDYSEYLQIINALMKQIYSAASVGNYDEAVIRCYKVARYAESLAAVLETKIEEEI